MKIRRAKARTANETSKQEAPPIPKFRIVCGYPRKSQAFGMTYTVAANDQSWLIQKGHELERAGHKVYKLQRRTNGEWVTI